MTTIAAWWMWPAFFVIVFTFLSLDMFFLGGKKAHHVSTREALGWFILWVCLALTFNFFLWWYLQYTHPAIADEKALEFFTGYLIEKALSVDNMFVFVMIFSYFAIPAQFQRKILLYGVLGAIVLRFIMISFGIFMISEFHWIFYLFGLFLIITGIKMFLFAEETPDLEKNPVLNWMRKHLRITNELHDEKFFVKHQSLFYVTPLFLVLVLIEISDIIFAIDSIPAIFSITEDPFIVFTSNIFAILGLRALYFLVANLSKRFHLLKYGIALILVFVGFKMILAPWLEIPIYLALSVVILILLVCILLSFHLKKKKKS